MVEKAKQMRIEEEKFAMKKKQEKEEEERKRKEKVNIQLHFIQQDAISVMICRVQANALTNI